jgi:hypothetical protein
MSFCLSDWYSFIIEQLSLGYKFANNWGRVFGKIIDNHVDQIFGGKRPDKPKISDITSHIWLYWLIATYHLRSMSPGFALLLLEALFTAIFWAFVPSESEFGLSHMCPWDTNEFEWLGLASYGPLREAIRCRDGEMDELYHV